MKKIAILGGGITGMTSAYSLSKKGYKVTIFEKTKDMGGLGACFIDENKCIYDYGPHQFCTDNPELLKILKEVLGDNLLVRTKNVSQYFFNKYVPYPPKLIDYFIKLPFHLSVRVILEVIGSRIESQINSKPDYSFETWTKSRFGSTLYNKYFKPYTIKTWGVDPDELDPSTASSRISFNSIFDIFFKTIKHYLTKKDDFSTIHNPLKNSFYYPKGGNVKLIEALYNACIKENVEFKTGFEAEEMIVKNGRAEKIIFTNKKSISDFDYVINTIPLTTLTKIMKKEYKIPLKFRGMTFVFLSFEKEQLSPYNWIYYPNKEIIFQRICEFKHFNADMCPKGKTGIVAEITCFKGDNVWNTPDDVLIKRVISDLKKVKILKGNEKYLGNVRRQEFVYPLQIKGFQKMVDEVIETEISPLKNVVTIGRQGLFKYCNQNECMEMALNVSKQIEDGTNKFNYDFKTKWKSDVFGDQPNIIEKEST